MFAAVFIASLALAAPSDADLNKAIQAKFPNAKIVSKIDCELGKKKVKTIAAVIQTRGAISNPLEPIVIQDLKSGLTVEALPKKLEGKNGFTTNFLDEFWNNDSKEASKVDIRCVTPGKDKDITTKANGEFKTGFKSIVKKVFGGWGKHACFAASSAYNSWGCFNFDKSGKIVSSYVQMNAD